MTIADSIPKKMIFISDNVFLKTGINKNPDMSIFTCISLLNGVLITA